jgi:hypothetical protein
VVVDAVVAAQTRQCAFEISVVVDVIEAVDEKIVGLVDVLVQQSASVEEAAGQFAFVGYLFVGKNVSRFATLAHDGSRLGELLF